MAESNNFIDYVKVHCTAGNGGQGSAHFHRSKLTAKGGPDGGDGGRGGHIVLKGSRNTWTLLPLKYRKHLKAGHGEGGGRNHCTGADGWDEVIEVPIGTIAKYADSDEVLFEISEHDEMQVLCFGGQGGKGNSFFKSSTHQTPRYSQPGLPGDEGWYVLELKVLADVGLVGFPNAGKSTLLSVVSAAKPKIANYAFTTLTPNLGVVAYRDHQSFVMADIPGIIEGASEGKGLGHRFLRHIERNATLLFMVPADSKNIPAEIDILLSELQKYDPTLLSKERIIAVSKSDMLDEELKEAIRQESPDQQLLFFSSVSGEGIIELKDALWKTLIRSKHLLE